MRLSLALRLRSHSFGRSVDDQHAGYELLDCLRSASRVRSEGAPSFASLHSATKTAHRCTILQVACGYDWQASRGAIRSQ